MVYPELEFERPRSNFEYAFEYRVDAPKYHGPTTDMSTFMRGDSDQSLHNTVFVQTSCTY